MQLIFLVLNSICFLLRLNFDHSYFIIISFNSLSNLYLSLVIYVNLNDVNHIGFCCKFVISNLLFVYNVFNFLGFFIINYLMVC